MAHHQRSPHDLSGFVAITDMYPFDQSGSSDIWRGVLNIPPSSDRCNVAIKVFRCARETEQEKVDAGIRAIHREIRVWISLSHPNVVPMHGFCRPDSILKAPLNPRLHVLVAPYFINGNVRVYLSKYPDVNRTAIVKQALKGLIYLHSKYVVHGALKAANVLIDVSGCAVLADFGLARIVGETGFTTLAAGGAARYSAPELLDAEEGTPPPPVTTASDVWAFGMTALEIFSGRLPFFGMSELAVVTAIAEQRRPNPAHYPTVPPAVWPILQSCWAESSFHRPETNAVMNSLRPL